MEEISSYPLGGLLNKENIHNFILTLLFDDVMYGIIYDLYKIIIKK